MSETPETIVDPAPAPPVSASRLEYFPSASPSDSTTFLRIPFARRPQWLNLWNASARADNVSCMDAFNTMAYRATVVAMFRNLYNDGTVTEMRDAVSEFNLCLDITGLRRTKPEAAQVSGLLEAYILICVPSFVTLDYSLHNLFICCRPSWTNTSPRSTTKSPTSSSSAPSPAFSASFSSPASTSRARRRRRPARPLQPLPLPQRLLLLPLLLLLRRVGQRARLRLPRQAVGLGGASGVECG